MTERLLVHFLYYHRDIQPLFLFLFNTIMFVKGGVCIVSLKKVFSRFYPKQKFKEVTCHDQSNVYDENDAGKK